MRKTKVIRNEHIESDAQIGPARGLFELDYLESELMRYLLLALFVVFGFGGQSIDLSSRGLGSIDTSSKPLGEEWRLEFHLTEAKLRVSGGFLRIYAFGGYLSYFLTENGSYIIDYRSYDTVDGFSPVSVACDECVNFTVRLQRDVENLRYVLEVWNMNNLKYRVSTTSIARKGSRISRSGIEVNPMFGNLGFLRVFSKTIPVGSRPPTTAETADWVDWKFEGDGADSSPSGRMNFNTKLFNFVSTHNNQVVAIARGAVNDYSLIEIPLRAGYPAKIYGNLSYSMSDESNVVSCLWEQLPHEVGMDVNSKLLFSDVTECAPTITGLVFGPYRFRLSVNDRTGATHSTEMEIGSVAWDDRCVVIYPDERLYTFLGPQVALGCNPWAWAENRFDTLARKLADGFVVNGGTWENPATRTEINGFPVVGTVWWNSTATVDRPVYGINTSFLKLFCGGQPGPADEKWIVHHTPDPSWGDLPRPLASYVTSCVSDTEVRVRPWLESGKNITISAPGVSWGVWGDNSFNPSAIHGTVYIENGATTVYGSGTQLQRFFCGGGTTPMPGASIRISDGSRFSGYAVASCRSDEELTLASPFQGRTVVAPGLGYAPYRTGVDIGDWYLTGSTNVSFYDNPAAFYRHYYATGSYKSLKAARYLVRANIQNPYHAPGWTAYWENCISLILSATVDRHMWGDASPWAAIVVKANGASRHITAAPGDQREVAYAVWYISLTAIFHPEENVRRLMRDLLIKHYNLQAVPYQDPDSGGYYSFYNDDEQQVWRVSKGADTLELVGGPAIESGFCGDRNASEGTISILEDRVSVIGDGVDFTGTVGKIIVLRGELNGLPHVEISKIYSDQSNTVTRVKLLYPWRGDEGSISSYWIVRDEKTYPVFSFQSVDISGKVSAPAVYDINDLYYCEVISPTAIKLDHPYTSDTDGGNIYRKRIKNKTYVYFPIWRQPFMDGMRASAYYLAYKALESHDENISKGYFSKLSDILNALYIDRDTVSNGQSYFRLSPTCKPYDFSVNTICDADASSSERDYWLESLWAYSMYYLETGKKEDKDRVDQIYNWVYAKPGFSSPISGDDKYSVWLDRIGWKQFGQAFGHGGGTAWAAAREGGSQTPVPRRVLFGFDLQKVPGATSAAVKTIAPSGAVFETECGASLPCEVKLDGREGAHWLQLRYLSATEQILATSELLLLNLD